MAKRKQVEVISDPPALDLEPTLVVDGTTYNINANSAKKLENSVTIKSTTETVEFNGDEAKSINVMSPDGGEFKGPITVPNHKLESNETFGATDVLNYTETVNVLLKNINNSTVVYKWEENKLELDTTTNSINSISIVEGKEADVDEFAKRNYANYHNYLDYLKNNNEQPDITYNPECFYMPVYFYIGNEDNSVYYGTAISTTANLLNINDTKRAEEADKLTYTSWFVTNLASTTRATFDGSKPEGALSGALIMPGVQGTLRVANGGTGKYSHALNAVLIGQGNNPIGEVDAIKGAFYVADENEAPIFGTLPVTCGGTGLQKLNKNAILIGNDDDSLITVDTEPGAFYATGNGTIPKFSVLPVTCGGTGSNNIDGITAGNAKNLGGKPAQDYQAKILIDTVDPTTSTDEKFTKAADGTIYIMYT